MNHLWSLSLLICTLGVPLEAGKDEELPSAGEILERALQRAAWVQNERHESKYRFRVLAVREDLDGEGQTTKTEQKLYENVPINGVPYQRLLERDGRPLGDGDAKKEKKKEVEFRRDLERGKQKKSEDGDRVYFNRELVSKYDFTLEGVDEIGARAVYVLSYKPKSDHLPVRRRIDRALNKASGEIWVDTGLYEVARVKFELKEKVKLWWGIMGSLSDVQGLVERLEVDEGVWLPNRVDIYLKGRIFFSSLHFRERVRWDSFREHKEAE